VVTAGKLAVGTLGGAIMLSLTPTATGNGELGAIITEQQGASGWTFDQNRAKIVDGNGNVVRSPSGTPLRDGSFASKVRNGSAAVGQVHHLIEATDSRAASRAVRDLAWEHAINANDPSWGVELKNHNGRHISQYSERLLSRLEGLSTRKDVLAELQKIKDELADIDKQIESGERKGDTVREWANDDDEF